FIGLTESSLVTIVIIIYFVVVDGYAVSAFITGAFKATGVTRQRMRFAAAGSGVLVAVLVAAGANAVLPQAREVTLPLIRVGAIVAALAFYLGFAPPRVLRRAWQHGELREYLQQMQMADTLTRDG